MMTASNIATLIVTSTGQSLPLTPSHPGFLCSAHQTARFTIRPVLISPTRIGGRFGRGFAAAFEVFLTTLEVFATSRFPTWEPAMTTQADDNGVPRCTGKLHTPSGDAHPSVAAFRQVSEFRRLA